MRMVEYPGSIISPHRGGFVARFKPILPPRPFSVLANLVKGQFLDTIVVGHGVEGPAGRPCIAMTNTYNTVTLVDVNHAGHSAPGTFSASRFKAPNRCLNGSSPPTAIGEPICDPC
jgi:hypothetical protein